MANIQDKTRIIMTIADSLRGPYTADKYKNVIIPFTILRRIECELEDSKEEFLKELSENPEYLEMPDVLLSLVNDNKKFYNTSALSLKAIHESPENLARKKEMLLEYKNAFSSNIIEILDNLNFTEEVNKLVKNNRFETVIREFSKADLKDLQNHEMGYVFEDLIRQFSETAEAGDHFTARELIQLMTNVLFIEDKYDFKENDQPIISVYDGTCGTGGMISSAHDFISELNPNREVQLFGQEINPESYAICKADMVIKGQEERVFLGNTLTNDGFKNRYFDYIFMNPPFGITWKDYANQVIAEHEKGEMGRFPAGLPAQSDGALLFVQHMISKLETNGRGAIILNASPLFSGGAGSGESNIRKWILDNDYLEAIIGLPQDLFYNTGIGTYIWIIDKQKGIKSPHRKGKIQLIDATSFATKLRKSLGSKRNEISQEDIQRITEIYHNFEENEFCKIFDNEDFMYRQITVERPLQLNFAITEDRIENLATDTTFMKKDEDYRNEVLNLLRNNTLKTVFKNREDFISILTGILNKIECVKDKKGNVDNKILKVIYMALSERDESSDICLDKKGNPEPDTTLRDTETVPYKEDIKEYFEREVIPHVSNPWIDEIKTKEGAEIPFTRHFYKYEKLKSYAECVEEVKSLELEIQDLLKELDM